MMDVVSPAQYRAFLERIYGFESAVELRAASIPAVSEAATGARARIYRLHQDLLALGLTEQDISAIPQPLVDGRTASDALGYLFVVERHTLLAGLLRRHLAPRLRDTFARARAYFDAHTEGGKHLREFGDELTASLTRKESRPEAILGAARRAFETQQQWYARSARATRRARRASDAPTPAVAAASRGDAA
ncbi:MAG: hypothetical protein JO257_06185 [Deltaproteobacteria bacterium]|nr:hypothetical protein [Deltaproteobacteria bacterium]